MTTSLPSQESVFTLEQRRMLGQVYNLILSWRNEKKNPEPTSSETNKNQAEETVQPGRPQRRESHD